MKYQFSHLIFRVGSGAAPPPDAVEAELGILWGFWGSGIVSPGDSDGILGQGSGLDANRGEEGRGEVRDGGGEEGGGVWQVWGEGEKIKKKGRKIERKCEKK